MLTVFRCNFSKLHRDLEFTFSQCAEHGPNGRRHRESLWWGVKLSFENSAECHVRNG
jgi:hypothetical protein